MKDPKKVAEGRRARLRGARFERVVRKDLESKNWIVDKWGNNVDLDYEADKFYKVKKGVTGLLVKAKSFMGRSRSNGFPDFICFKLRFDNDVVSGYEVIGVEVKTNGKLSKIEKEKVDWLLTNKIFSKVFIAMKDDNKKGGIIYKEFKKKKPAKIKLSKSYKKKKIER